jgi:TRAP-type mannitol/chloroaromatic compound transport system permease large subunit
LLPALFFAIVVSLSWRANTAPPDADALAASQRSAASAESVASGSGLQAPPGSVQEPPGAEKAGLAEPPSSGAGLAEPASASGGLAEPPAPSGSGLAEPPGAGSGSLAEPPGASGDLKEPPGSGGVQEPPSASGGVQEPPGAGSGVQEPPGAAAPTVAAQRTPATRGWWIGTAIGTLALIGCYALLSFQRLEVFKMLLSSFFPLLVLILAVLGSIVLGLATPTEAAAVGALGGFLLAVAYRQFTMQVLKESVFLTAKTSAMVCWLFVGSAIFSAAFALLGGQELVENWVMSMNLSKTEFLVLSQVIIFILGWPLEWTEIIVIFMPIFIPLLDNFGVDPLFFGLLVALNLQTAFLSPPVAMAAFYLKGVSPPHVTLNQIFAGMLPFMGIQIIAIILLYQFPAIGLWLPEVLYR